MEAQEEDESTVEQFSHPAPATVTATPTSSTRITVSWTAVTGAVKYYVYERVTMAGAEYFAGTTLAPGTSLLRANLQPGTEYCYRVRTEGGDGPGAYSSPLACATTPAVGAPPTPPATVTATATASDRITVGWSTVATATRYYVYQAIGDPNGTYTYINTVLAPGTSLNVANLLSNTLYCYKVASNNANGTSALSSAACDVTFVFGLEGYWKLNEGTGSTANDLSGFDRDGALAGGAAWTSSDRAPLDNNPYAVSLSGATGDAINVPDLSRWWFTGPFTLAIWTKVTSTAATRIAGKRGGGCGAVDWELGHDAGGLYFRGTSTLSFGSSLTVGAWSHVAVTYDGATARLYRDGAQVASGAFTAGPRSGDPMQLGNSGGCGGGGVLVDWAQIHSRALTAAEIQTIGERPPAPTNFVAAVAGCTRVNLSWDAVANVTKYFIYKGTMSGNETFFRTVLAPTTSSSDATNSCSTQVSYLVRSVRNGLISVDSNEQIVTTDPPIAAPTGVTATTLNSTRIRIDWNAVTGAVKYYVYQSVSGGPFGFRGTVLAGNPTTYTAANLTPSTMYSYYVITQGPDSVSSPSSTASATTSP